MLLAVLPGIAPAQTLRFVRMLEMDSEAGASLVSSDGRIGLVWGAHPSTEMRFWNLETGNIVADDVVQALGSCRRGALYPSGRHAVIPCRQPAMIDLSVPEIVTRFGEFDWSTITQVAVDPHLRRLVRVSRVHRGEEDPDNLPPDQVEVFELEEPGERSWFGELWYDWFGDSRQDADDVLPLPRTRFDSVYPSALTDDGRRLFMADHTARRMFWLENGALTRFSREDKPLVTGWWCGDQLARVTDTSRLLAIGTLLRESVPGPVRFTRCRFSRDGRVVYISYAGQLSAWNLTTGEELWSFDGAEHLDLSSNDEHLVVVDGARRLTILSKEGNIVAQAAVTRSQFAPASARYEKYSPCDLVHDPLSISADGRTVLYSHCAVFVFRLNAASPGR